MAGIYFISLGCDKNRIDAEIMAEALISAGHTITDDLADADAALINTCGFIDSAKEEAIENIFDMVRAKERGEIKAVIVTGCLAERYRGELRAQIPEIGAVLGLARNADIASCVERALEGESFEEYGDKESLILNAPRALSTPQHFAYIKLAEGCSNRCTYCAIPSIRGRFRSRASGEIISEARGLAARGVRELICVAQDTTSYGLDLEGGETLASLLQKLAKIEALWRIRVLYAYPERITDELIETIAREQRIAKYLDIPLQHASAEVLRRMGRAGSGEDYLKLIERLRDACPDITLRSSFIVGFPGETEEQFCELLEFLKKARLERAGCFIYSAEEGTPAARMGEQIPEEIKRERFERFGAVQNEVLLRSLDEKLNKSFEVICDGYDAERQMFACRGDADAPDVDSAIYIPLERDLVPGEVYTVRAQSADGADLLADLV